MLISELGRATPAAQTPTAQLVDRRQAALRAGIEHMQQHGEVSPRLDPDRTATALDASFELLRASA